MLSRQAGRNSLVLNTGIMTLIRGSGIAGDTTVYLGGNSEEMNTSLPI